MYRFDYSSAAEEIERETGLTTFFVDTNGTHPIFKEQRGLFLISQSYSAVREKKSRQIQ